jgi:hypothetical protein
LEKSLLENNDYKLDVQTYKHQKTVKEYGKTNTAHTNDLCVNCYNKWLGIYNVFRLVSSITFFEFVNLQIFPMNPSGMFKTTVTNHELENIVLKLSISVSLIAPTRGAAIK